MTNFLVTGGSGFIGSHLVERLLTEGNSVTALDNLSTGQLKNLDESSRLEGFHFVQGSVLDELVLDELVHEAEVVVHLAAAVGVKLIVEQPLRSLTTNIRGSENVIEAAHRYRRKIVLASTSEIYGKNSSGPLSETADRILGSPSVARWAYSAAKGIDEVLAYAYAKERGLPIVVARLFNTVGPRQSPAYGMVVPRLVRQAIRDLPLTVFGNGKQTRCFCHVEDVVGALVGLLHHEGAVGDVFNVGSQHEISIRALAERIIALADSRSSIDLIPYDRAYEPGFEDMERRVPDTSKLAALTGWQASRSLDEIILESLAEARLERAAEATLGTPT